MRVGMHRSAHHAADHQELLVVLLAEHGDVRQRLQQQLGDDGGDAGEEAGAVLALQHVAERRDRDAGDAPSGYISSTVGANSRSPPSADSLAASAASSRG